MILHLLFLLSKTLALCWDLEVSLAACEGCTLLWGRVALVARVRELHLMVDTLIYWCRLIDHRANLIIFNCRVLETALVWVNLLLISKKRFLSVHQWQRDCHVVVHRLLLHIRSLWIEYSDLLMLIALRSHHGIQTIHEPILIEFLNLYLVCWGVLIVESEQLVHQRASFLSILEGTVRSHMWLGLDIDGVYRLLLSSLGVENLASSCLVLAPLVHLTLLFWCHLQHIIIISGAPLRMTRLQFLNLI